MESAIATSINAIALADLKGNLTFVNSSFLKMWGYEKDKEVLGQSVMKFWLKSEDAEKIVKKLFDKGASIGEIVGRRKDGSIFNVQLLASIITDKSGRPFNMMASFIDITERKKAEQQVKQGYEKLQRTMEATIYTISKIIETRDPYTAGHQNTVSQLAVAIAQEMKLPEDKIEGIRIAALVHDIGKINIPAEILSKPSKLNEMEFSLIKNHPKVGYDILRKIDFPWPVAKIVLQHHEKIDGSGYPQGLKGEKILLEAKIIGVADVVEAMSSHRPYRPSLGIDKALEEIIQNRGVLYDPEVVDVCLKLFKEKDFKFES
jgi:PAS domain S-box-containing protein/putative nucleotidyltransferase with HDIG domain